MEALRESQVKHVSNIFEEALTRQVRAAEKAVLSGADPEQAVRDTPILDDEKKAFRDVAVLFAGKTYNAIRKSRKDFSDEQVATWIDRVNEYLASHGIQMIDRVNQTTKEMVRDVMTEAANEGWGVDKAARELRKKWEELSVFRAERIARTEIVAASNFGSQQGALSTGLKMEKEWLATPDGKTRPSHAAANGQTVGLDAAFSVGGAELQFPGDASLGAPADELVNCRCTQVYEVVE